MATLRTWMNTFGEFRASRRGRNLARIGQWTLTAGIVLYLLVRLSGIGWGNILAELPREPLFYLFFLLLYFSLPLSEVIVYRITWGGIPNAQMFRTLVRKRVLNRDVLGYSGEVFLYGWASKNVDLPEREILRSIRDTNIVSSIASTLIAVILLGVFLYLGHFNLRMWIEHQPVHYVALGLLGGAIIGGLLWRFRRHLFSMTLKTTLLVFLVYAVRLILGQALQIGQWVVVLPSVAIGVWFTFAAASLVLSRIPFLPNQDLVFLGASVELSTMMDVPTAAIASMLLVVSVLDKAMNLGLFLGISFWERQRAAKPSKVENTGVPSDTRPSGHAMKEVPDAEQL